MALERRRQHRRDWRKLWRRCRCGHRWVCPDFRKRIPPPFRPFAAMTDEEYRAGMEQSSPVPRVEYRSPAVLTPEDPYWTRNGRNGKDPLRNFPSGRHQVGQAGALTAARTLRGRDGERSSQAERAERR